MTSDFVEGISTIAIAGYGSDYDGEAFHIFVCDDCLKVVDTKPKQYEVVIRKIIDAKDFGVDCIPEITPKDFIQNVVEDEGFKFLGLTMNDIESVKPL